MDSLESVFLQAKEEGLYTKLQSLIEEKPETSIKRVKCTKKCFSLFETRGGKLLAEKQLENFQVLVSTLRLLASPTVTCFKKFNGFGLSQMMLAWTEELLSYPPSFPGLFKTVEDLIATVGIVAEYSVVMATSLLVFIPVLLRVGSDHYKNVSLRFEVIRVLNELLKICPVQKKRILIKEKKIKENLIHTGANLHNAGDFELQVGLLETLSRFTDVNDRRTLGPAWFDRINLTDQYLCIREEEFDIDSRYFLNNLNKAFAFNRSVYSLSCLQFKVGTQQLCKPSGMSEFWIDFNSSSRCISAFTEDVAASDTERMWETIYIKQDEVDHWAVSKNGGGHWTLCLSLYSPLPLPWDSSFSGSDHVTIVFSCDPRIALIKSIGAEKQGNIRNVSSGNTSLAERSKASIALVPVRVTQPITSEKNKFQHEDKDCVSPVLPNHNTADVIFQLSSKSSNATPTKVAPPPKTPQTSTPKKQPIMENPLMEKSGPVCKFVRPVAPSSVKGSNKTPKFVKQPLSFLGRSENNFKSDLVVSKRKPLKENTNQTLSLPKDTKQNSSRQKATHLSKVNTSVNSSLENSFTMDRGEDRRSKRNSSSVSRSETDKKFDFPDSPQLPTAGKPVRRQPIKKSKNKGKGSNTKKCCLSVATVSEVLERPTGVLSSGRRSKEGDWEDSKILELDEARGIESDTLKGNNGDTPINNSISSDLTKHDSRTKNVNHTHKSQSVLMDEAVNSVPSPNESLEADMGYCKVSDNQSENEKNRLTSDQENNEVIEIQAEPPGVVNMVTATQCSSIKSGPGTVVTMQHSREPDVEEGSVCVSSPQSFHFSQVQPDVMIVQAFEEICSSIVNTKKEKIPKSRARERFSPVEHTYQQLNEREWPEKDLPSPPKKPRLQATETPVGVFHTKKKKKLPKNTPSLKRSDVGSNDKEDFNPTCSNRIVESHTSEMQDESSREFLLSFDGQLGKEVSRIEDGLKKSEDYSEKALNTIKEMSSECDSIHQLAGQVKELYKTLFVDLRDMNSHEEGSVQRKHQSMIEEIKAQRERMLKQAHEKEVQHMRKTMQSLIMCWQLS